MPDKETEMESQGRRETRSMMMEKERESAREMADQVGASHLAPQGVEVEPDTGDNTGLEAVGLGTLFGDTGPSEVQEEKGATDSQSTGTPSTGQGKGAAAPATLGWRADNTAEWADRWKQREKAKRAGNRDPFWNQAGGRLWQQEGAPCGMGRPIAGEGGKGKGIQ